MTEGEPGGDAGAAFQKGYYSARYQTPIWRRRGDQPIFNRTRLRSLRRLVASGRLLDVGCGEGYFLQRAKAAYDCWGIDVSAEGVEFAIRNTGLQTITVHSAAESLPFEAEFFDVLTSFDVVEHLPRPELFLREACRVLRPGGILLLSTPNPDSIGARVKGRASHVYSDRTHISVKSATEWRRLVVDSGFNVIRDGTDALWDWPYVPIIPRVVQRVVFAGTSQLLGAFDILFPWSRGENYLCIARR